MRKLTAYQATPMVHFNDIVDSKEDSPIPRHSTLKKLRGYVEDRYREYARTAPHLEQMISYVEPAPRKRKRKDEPEEPVSRYRGAFLMEELEALTHCYDGDTDALKALKQQIDTLQQKPSKCPYCGINSPDTWDHHLPKAHFPELSVYGPNLIRCCDPCNRKKGDDWVEGGERIIIHVYYDPIDARALLTAEVTVKDQRPRVLFSFVDGPEEGAAFQRVFRRHCEKLDLFERYKWCSADVLGEIEDDIRSRIRESGAVDGDRLSQALSSKADDQERRYGKNSWSAALWRAVSRAPDVVDLFARPEAEDAQNRHREDER